MSKTNYFKKFIFTGLSFKKTSFSQEDNEKSDFRISKQTKDSWKFFSNLKGMTFLKKNNSVQDIQKMTNYLSPNKNNPNYIPISNKYSIIRFNKAPTLRENKNEIDKIIKNKKHQKKEELSNIFNTILINESRLFRNNIYITGGGINSLRNNSKSIIFDRNKGNEYMTKKIQYNSKFENNSSSQEFANINIDTRFNSYSLNNESNILTDTIKNNNRSKTQYPLFKQYNPNINYIPKLIIKKYEGDLSPFRNKNIENSNKSRNITRMRMEINDLIFNNYRLRGEFSNLEKMMIKFKVIQNIQDTKLNNILSKEENEIDKKYNKLISFKNDLENKYIIYSEKMNKYLDFLIDKTNELKTELKYIEKTIEDKYSEIEKLSFEIIKSQNKLESLVDKRNFLLQVKQKYKNPPIYYEELLIKDSKKLVIGNSLFNLDILKHSHNKNIIDFLDSFSDIKRKINENILDINNIESDLYISSNFLKEKLDPIFDSVDDFIHLYSYLKEKSINYLKRAEIEKKSISIMKKEYEENYLNENNYLEKEIYEKEIEKKKIIHKNQILIDTYNYYKDNILKKINNISLKSYNFNIKINQKRFINIDNDLREKYNKQLKKYKYGGILLLKKLIKLIKFYTKFNYDKSDYYLNLFDDKKLEITLNIDITEFNDDNILLIDRYILLLISKYEKICKYILNKHQIYLLDEKNRQIIKRKKDEINNLRRYQISKEIKNLIKKKKIEEINKIIEKSNKSIVYIPNRINCDGHQKKRAQKINKEKIISFIKKNYLEKEFNDLTKYNDDNL